MNKFKEICKEAELIKNEYEWLLELNDNSLADQVKRTNDVQNALLELLRLVDDVIDCFEDTERIVELVSNVDEQQIIPYKELKEVINKINNPIK
jgi:hypothetical protein